MINYIDKLKQRYESLNSQRIERSISMMGLKSQHVYQLIPVLFQYNQKDIPGYIESIDLILLSQ